jgi:tetratricopeptide (TPR) repeat protein
MSQRVKINENSERVAKMRKISLNDIRVTCEGLLDGRAYKEVAQVVANAIPHLTDRSDWQVILEIFTRIPPRIRLESAEIATIYANALAGTWHVDDLLEFTVQALKIHADSDSASISLIQSVGLLEKKNFSQVIIVLAEIIPFLTGYERGIALARLGIASFNLGLPWEKFFLEAQPLLHDRFLGLSLQSYGYCLNEVNRNQEAQIVWFKALSYFKTDFYNLALLHRTLGYSLLQTLNPGAERHFLEGLRIIRNPKAARMRSIILNGLAISRRILGEWDRALFMDQRSLVFANDDFDRQASHSSMLRCLRLAGRINQAVEELELKSQDFETTPSFLCINQALTWLAFNENDRAEIALERAGLLTMNSDIWLANVARAELARRRGQFTEAVQWLEGNPTHTLHMREEVRQWPELFALAKAAGLPIPEPLEYVQGSTVQVRARGVLHVAVNDRGVAVPPTGRVGELLVFLLEHEGEAPLDVILEAFYPNAVGQKERARARKMVWEHANTLRELLGWQDAVIALGGAYQLDPQTTWQYDIREARALKMFNGEFLAGVYSEWALEVGQELAGFAVASDAGVHLN